jgi:hypothetical protein
MGKNAPNTSNPEAKALIERAQRLCPGCRVSWRIRRNWKHDVRSGGAICIAQIERQELRDIAARFGKELTS